MRFFPSEVSATSVLGFLLTISDCTCTLWQERGLQTPQAVQRATRTYRESEDQVGRFVNEWCLPDPHGEIRKSDLYDGYRQWCEACGERPDTMIRFGKQLTSRGLEESRSSRERRWVGITLGDRWVTR
jgi:phage/plasmid-associated DNA primase